MSERIETGASPGRTLAFRIVSAVLGFAVVGLTLPFAIGSFVGEDTALHRMHNTNTLIGFGGLIGVLLVVCAWRPLEQLAAFRVAVAASFAGVVTGLISADLVAGGWIYGLVAAAVTWVLHPARGAVFRLGGMHLPQVFLSLLAFVPGIAWALTQSKLQRNGLPAVDEHAEFHHYSGMAAAGLTLPLVWLVASFDAPGRRFAVWFVGGCTVALGIASLALQDYAGSFDPLWSWLTIAGGIVYIAVSEVTEQSPATVT